MFEERNKAIARRVVEEIWNRGDLSTLSTLFAPEFVFHDPANPLVKSLRDYEHFVMTYRRAFPDLQMVIEGQIAERELVMTWWGARGTHKGPLLAILPTNKIVTVTGITLDLIRGNKIVESRVNWDALGLYQQLGVLPGISIPLPAGVGSFQTHPIGAETH